jgi:DeoR family transcriptional regulator, ulaG and ulaABCDEF operon transcriptional repressor
MEGDPLLVQAEQKLIGQADELVVLVDSTKFANAVEPAALPAERIDTIITDDGIDRPRRRDAGGGDIRLIVAPRRCRQKDGGRRAKPERKDNGS